jgi:hypothetical protein
MLALMSSSPKFAGFKRMFEFGRFHEPPYYQQLKPCGVIMQTQTIENRLDRLERQVKHRNLFAISMFIFGVSVALIGVSIAKPKAGVIPEIRTHKLSVVDNTGHVRIQIAEDEADTQRISRAAGITFYDAKGDERGGMGTMADGSAVMAFDAPPDGKSSPDRIGLKVFPDGSLSIQTLATPPLLSSPTVIKDVLNCPNGTTPRAKFSPEPSPKTAILQKSRKPSSCDLWLGVSHPTVDFARRKRPGFLLHDVPVSANQHAVRQQAAVIAQLHTGIGRAGKVK